MAIIQPQSEAGAAVTAHVSTVAFEGLNVIEVDVQAHISPGMPSFSIVGLPNKAVAESKERVRSALNSAGVALPAARITVNLSPADIVKEGNHYDLPVMMALLAECGVIPADSTEDYFYMGEVALDGALCRVSGCLPAAIFAGERERGLVVPPANAEEAALSGNEGALVASRVMQAADHCKGKAALPSAALLARHGTAARPAAVGFPDLRDVRGQESAKRALEIAAAGGHNLLMIGPPGSGKSMLAARLPGLLPPMTSREILETGMIASISGKNFTARDLETRPYRAPHHSCSMAAMTGGGARAMPGEITMAHRGVLFLDELPEFPRATLEGLRQPLETGTVTVARANRHITYPAKILLTAAMNPCRCGYLSDPARCCRKAPACGEEYSQRVSGPIYDRIDLSVHVESLTPQELRALPEKSECTAKAAERVMAARERQAARYRGLSTELNSEAQGEEALERTRLTDEARSVTEQAIHSMGLSMRGYYRAIRTARTIADLAGSEDVKRIHALEALAYRPSAFRNTKMK